MKKTVKLKKFLEGKKSYLVAVSVVVVGVTEWLGGDVPGVVVGSDPLSWILSGLGLGALRAGLKK